MEKIFIDTNLLCYIFDDSETEKQDKAKQIISDLAIQNKVQISTQVLQELSNVLEKKFGFSADKVYDYVKEISKFPVHCNSVSTVLTALELRQEASLSLWDSLIVSAAKESGCSVLYSEDMSAGQTISGVKTVNPFLM